MRIFIGLVLIIGIAVFIRDNNVHYVLKGLLAAWPILVLLALAKLFIWNGLEVKGHTHFRAGNGNQSHETGDPIAALLDKAEKARIKLNIRHPDD